MFFLIIKKLIIYLFKLNSLKTKELKTIFHPELYSTELYKHRCVIYNDVSVIDEYGKYHKGHFLLNLTTNPQISKKDLDLLTKTNHPIIKKFPESDSDVKISKIYFYIYFVESKDIFNISRLNSLTTEKLTNPSLFHQLFYNSISKNYCEIVEASTKKKCLFLIILSFQV